eukprot:11980279-Alexandrium_andersonii.AAC.1
MLRPARGCWRASMASCSALARASRLPNSPANQTSARRRARGPLQRRARARAPTAGPPSSSSSRPRA